MSSGEARPRTEPEAAPEAPVFAELGTFRIVEVAGSDARAWLNDLVTGPVGSLEPGRSTRSLLLTPTGRIRADFHIADVGRLVLLQDGSQPHAVHDLLSPYVLSSDVELTDVSERMTVLALPGAPGAPELPGAAATYAPSVLGPGVDVLVERSKAPDTLSAIVATRAPADEAALERWRIELGVARFGVDFPEGALPAEAALENAIDFTKGCFLGQESVAKVRNLGHPRSVLVALSATEAVAVGDIVRSDGQDVGTITSSAASARGTDLLASVSWERREAELKTVDGVRLTPREGRSPSGT